MTSESNKLTLTDAELIGAGAHKITYTHPHNKVLCVKIIKKRNDTDLNRELHYRSVLQKRHKYPKLIPSYHGTIETNKGLAHVFERIYDYDGKTSMTMDQYIAEIISTSSLEEARERLLQMLQSFKKSWFEEQIVTSNIELVNFMIQKKTAEEVCVRIVDNIGTPVLIPLAYYFDFFAAKRASRYWQRFLGVLQESFPDFFDKNAIAKLT